ncbi:30S ribosomal protein S5, partial [Streptomyces sp. SID10692]|nr:30S ribosomal protein S5 [Streptomyces sp. SID10692]
MTSSERQDRTPRSRPARGRGRGRGQAGQGA